MLIDILSFILLIIGSIFVLAGTIGVIRLPDLYTRLHAASIVDTLGCMALIAGMVLQAGFSIVTIKLLLVLALIFFTSPVATHALAKAAAHGGVMPEADE